MAEGPIPIETSQEDQENVQAVGDLTLENLSALNLDDSDKRPSELLRIWKPDPTILTIFKSGTETFALTKEQISKVPYLEALCIGKENFEDVNKNAETQNIILNPSINTELMKIIIKYIQTGRERGLFTSLPKNIKGTEIFKLLDYLGVKKPSVTLADLEKRLKNTKTSIDKRGWGTYSNRPYARDACVILCWIGIQLVSGYKEQDKIAKLVFFILTHPRTYYLTLRRLTLEWYLDSFDPPPKQIATLQGWFFKCPKYPSVLLSDESSSGGSCSGSSDDGNYST